MVASVHPNHLSNACTCTLILYIFAATCMEGSQLLRVPTSTNSQPASGRLSSQCPHNMVILGATINLCEPFKHTDHNRFSVLFPWCDNNNNNTIHNQHQPTVSCHCAYRQQLQTRYTVLNALLAVPGITPSHAMTMWQHENNSRQPWRWTGKD